MIGCKKKPWQGNVNALNTLRARQVRAKLKGDTLFFTKCRQTPRGHPGCSCGFGDQKGTIIYHFAGATIRDDGKLLKVSKGAGQEALEAALRMAVERFGKNLTVNGGLGFKEQVVRTAAAARLKIEFDDPDLEKRRLFFMTGEDPDGAAAHKYIEERNQKRSNIADIAEHRRFSSQDAGELLLPGDSARWTAKPSPLQKGEQILVLPVDHSTATRLQRLRLGDAVSVTAERTIEVQGRSLRTLNNFWLFFSFRFERQGKYRMSPSQAYLGCKPYLSMSGISHRRICLCRPINTGKNMSSPSGRPKRGKT